MNCPDVQELLSAYYDGELPDDKHADVKVHLDGCSECARQLAGFEKLSALATSVATPDPPSEIWEELERQLDEEPAFQPVEQKRRSPLTTPRLLTLAASLLIAVGIGWWAYQSWHAPNEHDHLAVDFDEYLELFPQDPAKAQQLLAAKYDGHPVEIEAAAEQLGYRPSVADGLPDGMTLVSTHVMKMPCCTCVGCVCERDDGSKFASFEHDDEQPVWFGDRPAVAASCCGKRCSLMQVDSDLVVGWQQGRRHITVIGARDLEEINQLVAWLDERKRVRPK